MDHTRAEAGRRGARGPPPVQTGTAIYDDALERSVAAFVVALARAERDELLAGLAESRRALAISEAEDLASVDSSTRQARLARHFGTRRDADARLRRLMAEVGPALRLEIFRRLPPYHRSLFPAIGPVTTNRPTPELTACADRLIREATL